MEITRAITLILAFVFVQDTNGFSVGAPASVCLGHHAHHDTFYPQETPCPYKMTFSSNTYSPGQLIDTTLKTPLRAKFMGFLVYAHRTVGDMERPVGEYTAFPDGKARLIDCVNMPNAGLTNNNSDIIQELEFQWKAPDSNVGDIQFKFMVVEEFETFWVDQRAPLLKATVPYVEPAPGQPKVADSTPDINWDLCGKTKGCFLYPRLCSGADCKAAVTYTPNYKGFLIEMFVADHEYVSVGFSHDKLMTRDHVHVCVAGNDMISVQNGYNPALHFMRIFKDGMTEMAVKKENGKLTCRFQRPASMSVYTSDSVWGNETWDLNNEYYLFLSWGAADANTVRMAKHIETPAISDDKVNFNELGVVRGSTFPILTQIHATLSMIAWIVFVGIVTVIARYYKDLKPEAKIMGMKYWIQIHRYSGGIAWVLTAIGFVVIFVKVKDFSQTAVVHSYLGIAVMAVCSLQMISGIYRPDAKAKTRPAFNIIHWLVGKGSHILSALTIFFAYSSDIVAAEQRTFGYVVTGVWVVAQLLWEVAFEFRRFRLDSDNKKEAGTTTCENIMLFMYVATLILLSVAQLLAIFLF